MDFTFSEITNKNVPTQPSTGQHGLNVNGNPFVFGAERNISYGWNWIGETESEVWVNRNMAHFGFGSVCVGRHGELYYVFRKGFDHGVSQDSSSQFYNVGGDLYYIVSYDSGETWSKPVMFLQHEAGYDLRDVTLAYYPEHDMYVLIYENRSIDYDSMVGTMHILSTPNLARPRNTDTIKEPFPISNMTEWTLPTSNMYSVLNQTFHKLVPVGSYFYLPFYGTDDAPSLSAGLLRFSRGVVGLPTGEVLKKWTADGSNESTFFTSFNSENGIRFNMLFRGGSGDGDNAMVSYSDDYGATWSEKVGLGFDAAGGPQVFDINGKYMLVARDQDNTNTHYTYAMFSTDGQTWGDKIFLSSLGTSYASMAQLANGRTLLFYSKEMSKSIICMREVYGLPTMTD